jgi:hypothetical protein
MLEIMIALSTILITSKAQNMSVLLIFLSLDEIID